MARRFLRGLVIAATVLVGVCVALAAGAWLWLRTDGGRRFVLDRLRDELAATAGVELDAERLSGTPLSHLRLEGVDLRACPQRVRVRAARVDLRYSLASLLRGRPRVDVVVEEPVVSAVRCETAPRRPPRPIEVATLVIHRGRSETDAIPLRDVEIDGEGSFGPDGATRFHLQRASARLFDASRIEASGTATSDRIDVVIDARVADEDLPEPAGVKGPIAVHVQVAGPPPALAVEGELRPARGAVRFAGTVDVPGGSAEMKLVPSGLAFAPGVGEAEVILSGTARLSVAREAGGVRVELEGRGEYTRRVVDPSLLDVTRSGGGTAMRRHAEKTPGGAWAGRVKGRAGQEGFTAELEAELADAVLRGKLVVPRAGRPRLQAKIVSREAE